MLGLSKFPFGFAFNKGLSLAMGQTHVQRYVPDLLKLIQEGSIDPSFVITHAVPLEEAPRMYEIFKKKRTAVPKSYSSLSITRRGQGQHSA
jgi:threonine dehydrogenase-like Zn-dependent dehydrogenase